MAGARLALVVLCHDCQKESLAVARSLSERGAWLSTTTLVDDGNIPGEAGVSGFGASMDMLADDVVVAILLAAYQAGSRT